MENEIGTYKKREIGVSDNDPHTHTLSSCVNIGMSSGVEVA